MLSHANIAGRRKKHAQRGRRHKVQRLRSHQNIEMCELAGRRSDRDAAAACVTSEREANQLVYCRNSYIMFK